MYIKSLTCRSRRQFLAHLHLRVCLTCDPTLWLRRGGQKRLVDCICSGNSCVPCLPSKISCFALLISSRMARMMSALKFSNSSGLASDRPPPSPFTCFRIVSSLALPNRFRDGRGDSGPLPPLFGAPLFD